MAEGEVKQGSRADGALAGRWPFSSGIDPVTWVMLGGRVARADGGAPEPHLFLVPRADYRVDRHLARDGPRRHRQQGRGGRRGIRPGASRHRGRHRRGRAASRQRGQSRSALSPAVVSGVLVRQCRHAARHRAWARCAISAPRSAPAPRHIPARRWPIWQRAAAARRGRDLGRCRRDGAAQGLRRGDGAGRGGRAFQRSSTARGGGATAPMRPSSPRAPSISSSPAPAAAPSMKPIRCSARCATSTRPTAISA